VFAAVLMARIEGWELPPAVLSAQRHWRKVRAERVAEARKAQVAAIENAAKRNVAEAMKQFRRDLDAAINTDGMGLWPEGQSFHGEDSHGAKT
jgi:regulator of protease activity HflC (stomatin/prohibitin superfamily)